MVAAVVSAIALIALAAALSGASTAASLSMVAAAGGAALAVAPVGAGLLTLSRGRSFGAHVAIVVLSAVGAVVAGSLVAAAVMFQSAHDQGALWVVITAAAVAGCVVALGLSRRVMAATTRLGEAARDLSVRGAPSPSSEVSQTKDDTEDVPHVAVGSPTIAEFDRLADDLDRTAARLQALHAREQKVEAARRELVSWVSHDLRTPLAGMLAVTEALQDGIVTDPQTVERYLHTLHREIERLRDLVDDLFDLSRIHAGALDLHPQRCALKDLVSDAIASAKPMADAKGVRLEGRVRDPAPVLSVSVAEIARVFQNLLSNAVRETPPGESVCVRSGVAERLAFVTVQDSCGGIPAGDLPRVFDASFRGEDGRASNQHNGAGLGLAIAHGIALAHGGELSVRNRGPGCEFTLRLPLSESTPNETLSAPER